MRGSDPDVVPVELVEVEGPRAPHPGAAGRDAGTVGEAGPKGARTRRRRVRAAVLVGAVLLGLAAVGLGASVLDARREQARWDALAGRGQPLVDLDAPLAEAWRADDGGWSLGEAGGLLLVQGSAPPSSIRAVDPGTGAIVWETPIGEAEWCQIWHPRLSDVGTPVQPTAGPVPGRPDAALLVCLSDGEQAAVGTDGADAVEVTNGARVRDVATGEVLGTAEVPGVLTAVEFRPEGLVVLGARGDGSPVVTLVALPDVDASWTARGGPLPLDEGEWLTLTVVDGVVNVQRFGGPTVLAYDVATGAVAEPTVAEHSLGGGRYPLPDGGEVEIVYDLLSSVTVGAPGGIVRGPDGAERFRFTGELWSPRLTDGSAGDRIVVLRGTDVGARLTALDVVTGEELWSAPGTYSVGIVQVDGLAVAGSGYVTATDLSTGEQVWSGPIDAGVGTAVITDGSRVVVSVLDGGTSWFVALDIRSGAEAWRVPVDDRVQNWRVLDDGTVLGEGDGGLVAYR